MSKSEDFFKSALSGKNIPILTLDNKWHKLFAQARITPKIESLEKEVNALLKRQGKINTETKSIKVLKKKLMDEIVNLADELDETGNVSIQKKLEKHQRLVEECNEKLAAYKDEMLDLPRELEQANYKLMLETMNTCYERLSENVAEIEAFEAWIKNIRVELKKNVIRKQEKEVDTYELYSYMHDIFGADVINIFDMHYNPEQFAPQKSKKEDASKQ